MYLFVLPVLLFYVSWGIHYIWSRRTGRTAKERFYYQRSFWVIFTITVLAALGIDILVTIWRLKN